MGIADAPVASSIAEYAPLALALGRDPERRRALRETIGAACSREIFGDVRAVRQMEEFFHGAVAAARSGQRLEAGWRPSAAGTA